MVKNFKVRAGSVALASVVLATLALPSAPAFAQSEQRQFNIPAQTLATALEAFGRQSGKEILFDRSQTLGKRSQAISGSMSAERALRALLSGTGLVERAANQGTFLVERTKDTVSSLAGENGVDDDSAGEEIVVTGTNIRGVTDLPSPSVTYTRSQIEQAGYTTVEEVFRSLPQNVAEISPTASLGVGTSRISSENNQGVVGISLRGLGPESTLVLLNGKRRAGNLNGRVFDIAMIPVALLERIEIVTGGRSAVYGSDAVAGVVNLVTTKSYSGFESDVTFSANRAGGRNVQATQIAGLKGDAGGIVGAFDYAWQQDVDVSETGLSVAPSAFGLTPVTGGFDLVPSRRRYSGYLAGQWRIAQVAEVYFDGLYGHDTVRQDVAYDAGGTLAFNNSNTKSKQFSGVAGVRLEPVAGWEVDLSATHGGVNVTQDYNAGFGAFQVSGTNFGRTRLSTVSAVADGSVFAVGEVDVRAAIGAEHRWESYRDGTVGSPPAVDLRRNVRSVFGEIYVPLVTNGGPGLRALNLSAAIRYDDYSDVGDTTNHQFGAMWVPFDGLRFKASRATAFRAPSLYSKGFSLREASLFSVADPSTGTSSPLLILTGSNPGLGPERAVTWTAGFEIDPAVAPWLHLEVSYFNIRYRNRIDEPAQFADFANILVNQGFFGDLIDRAPSAVDLAQALSNLSFFSDNTGSGFDPASQNILDVFPDIVVFDNRRANIAVDSLSGIDGAVRLSVPFSAGVLTAGVNGTYYIDFDRQFTPSSPKLPQLNLPGKTIDFRLRGNLGYSSGPFAANLFVNYSDGYKDTASTPVARITSWTTVDVSLQYRVAQGDPSGKNGMTFTLAAQNLFDAEPPFFGNDFYGFGFDPTNANGLGRVVSARFALRW
jgi:outer membrane cobalamin receptor